MTTRPPRLMPGVYLTVILGALCAVCVWYLAR